MWKKTDDDNTHTSTPSTTPRPAPDRTSTSRDRAVIGPSITVKGDISGNEDLLIEGTIEGKVDLRQNEITVGKSGRVKADIIGRVITIAGQVEGNLHGGEHIVLSKSSSVRGNLSAARVSLEDGSNFKGSIDMAPKGQKIVAEPAPQSTQPQPPTSPSNKPGPSTPANQPNPSSSQQRRA